jgi:GTP cyclohydrolase I
MPDQPTPSHGAQTERLERLRYHFRAILETLGLDLRDPNLQDTDYRVARAYLELFSGLEEDSEPKLTTFPNDEHYNQMVLLRDIPFYTMCAHHFLPFFGKAHIAYFPGKYIIGLSKLARVVEFYARRPQIQERMTEQIITYLEHHLEPLGAMVVIEANHLCLEMRGAKKPGAITTTSAIRGVFREREVREEFLNLLRK